MTGKGLNQLELSMLRPALKYSLGIPFTFVLHSRMAFRRDWLLLLHEMTKFEELVIVVGLT
ncbi:hypothetical protein MAR_035432, partial [Mya arenaria]